MNIVFKDFIFYFIDYIIIFKLNYYFYYNFYFIPQINKGSEDLPIEYLTSSLAQQNQVSSIYYLRVLRGVVD